MHIDAVTFFWEAEAVFVFGPILCCVCAGLLLYVGHCLRQAARRPRSPRLKPTKARPTDGTLTMMKTEFAVTLRDIGKLLVIKGEGLLVDGVPRHIRWDGTARPGDVAGVILNVQERVHGAVVIQPEGEGPRVTIHNPLALAQSARDRSPQARPPKPSSPSPKKSPSPAKKRPAVPTLATPWPIGLGGGSINTPTSSRPSSPMSTGRRSNVHLSARDKNLPSLRAHPWPDVEPIDSVAVKAVEASEKPPTEYRTGRFRYVSPNGVNEHTSEFNPDYKRVWQARSALKKIVLSTRKDSSEWFKNWVSSGASRERHPIQDDGHRLRDHKLKLAFSVAVPRGGARSPSPSAAQSPPAGAAPEVLEEVRFIIHAANLWLSSPLPAWVDQWVLVAKPESRDARRSGAVIFKCHDAGARDVIGLSKLDVFDTVNLVINVPAELNPGLAESAKLPITFDRLNSQIITPGAASAQTFLGALAVRPGTRLPIMIDAGVVNDRSPGGSPRGVGLLGSPGRGPSPRPGSPVRLHSPQPRRPLSGLNLSLQGRGARSVGTAGASTSASEFTSGVAPRQLL